MTGRPPSTFEGEVRALARLMRKPGGDMTTRDRLAVMHALIEATSMSVRMTGQPDRLVLVRLAAHAAVWAEDADEEGENE